MNNASTADILQQSFSIALDLIGLDAQIAAVAKATQTGVGTLIAQHADTKYAIRGDATAIREFATSTERVTIGVNSMPHPVQEYA